MPCAHWATGTYDVVCLTSPNGAELLLDALGLAGLDARALAGTTLAAIGPGTAAALARRGLRADVCRNARSRKPSRPSSRSAASREVVCSSRARRRPATCFRTRCARRARRSMSWRCTKRCANASEQSSSTPSRAPTTSPSRAPPPSGTFVDALGGREHFPSAARVVSIGPITSETAAELGLRVDVEAERHDIDGLVEALLADVLRGVTQPS